MEIEVYTELTTDQAAQWRAFQATSPHQHPRQDPHFADVERASGKVPLFVTGRRNGALCAVGLFSLQPHPFLQKAFSEALCLSGPTSNNSTDMLEFLDCSFRQPAFARVGRIKITPYWIQQDAEKLTASLNARGWARSEPDLFRSSGQVDLSQPVEDIFAAFSKSARREVRRAGRQGITLRPIKKEAEATVFLDSLNRMRLDRGLSALETKSFMCAFRKMYSVDDGGIIIAAWHGETFLAGLQLYCSRLTAHGRQFTTETTHLRVLSNLRIAPLLWFEGMKWAKGKGCTALDVEGWMENPDVKDQKFNIYKYKSEFGPTAIRRIAEHAKTRHLFVNVTGNGLQMLKDKVRPLLK